MPDSERDLRARARQVRRLLVDTAPLRLDRDYRYWWSGQLVSAVGNHATRVALRFQIYVLTGSILAVGALTLVQFVAILLFGLAGGSLADAVDRRKLLIVAHIGMGVTSVALVVVTQMPSPPQVLLFILAFLGSGLGAVDLAVRGSAIPRLVPRERLSSAMALNQLNGRTAAIVGPLLAGFLIAIVGVGGVYAMDAITFIASLAALLAIAPIPPLARAARPGLKAIRQGLAFVLRRRLILSVLVADFAASVFGMPTSLFPALALDVFHVGAVGFGLLNAAPAVGALVAAVLSGWTIRVERSGRALIICLTVWGVAITAFGILTFSFPLAWLALAVAGGADVLSAVFRSTIVQLATPERIRGRVTSIYSLTAQSGSRLGDVEAALVASVVGPQASVISGGLACLASVAAIVRWMPELAAHTIQIHRLTPRVTPAIVPAAEPDG